ncbi:hypothetical protein LXL04_015290 [Taraxacum kok-saghyz]
MGYTKGLFSAITRDGEPLVKKLAAVKTIMSHSRSSGNKKVASSFLVCSEHLPESANKSSQKSRSRSAGNQSESGSNNPNYDSESSIGVKACLEATYLWLFQWAQSWEAKCPK